MLSNWQAYTDYEPSKKLSLFVFWFIYNLWLLPVTSYPWRVAFPMRFSRDWLFTNFKFFVYFMLHALFCFCDWPFNYATGETQLAFYGYTIGYIGIILYFPIGKYWQRTKRHILQHGAHRSRRYFCYYCVFLVPVILPLSNIEIL